MSEVLKEFSEKLLDKINKTEEIVSMKEINKEAYEFDYNNKTITDFFTVFEKEKMLCVVVPTTNIFKNQLLFSIVSTIDIIIDRKTFPLVKLYFPITIISKNEIENIKNICKQYGFKSETVFASKECSITLYKAFDESFHEYFLTMHTEIIRFFRKPKNYFLNMKIKVFQSYSFEIHGFEGELGLKIKQGDYVLKLYDKKDNRHIEIKEMEVNQHNVYKSCETMIEEFSKSKRLLGLF